MKYSEHEKRYHTAGIYKLVFGNEFYIGSSMNIQNRADQHYYSMRSGKSSIKLNNAWEKYKEFDLVVLEYIDNEKPKWYLREREEYYINRLNPPLNGGHVTGIKSEIDSKYSEESRLPIKEHRNYIRCDYSFPEEQEYNEKNSNHLNFQFTKNDVIYVLRATIEGGKVWFVVCDFAGLLDYNSTTYLLKKHVSSENIYPKLLRTDKKELARFISKEGVMSLLSGSKKAIAYEIKAWFEDEVIPKINQIEAENHPEQ